MKHDINRVANKLLCYECSAIGTLSCVARRGLVAPNWRMRTGCLMLWNHGCWRGEFQGKLKDNVRMGGLAVLENQSSNSLC